MPKRASPAGSAVPAPGRSAEEIRNALAACVHDLNNALGVLRLTADMLERGLEDPVAAGETIRGQVDQALVAVAELRRLAGAG